ncbi:MAG: GTPase Era [Desulfobacterales bacterium]|jgi:GTP-binding protein Era|nr:GTPase Era [Desulfobacterales bacterium]
MEKKRKMKPMDFKSGFIGIVGAPNVGKSTLLNRLLGGKISITSKKPQTTRNRILGIVQRPASQIIFIDTPGIFSTLNRFNIRMVETALSVLGDVDIALLMIDASKPDPCSEQLVVKKLRNQKKPVILAFNKIDIIERSTLLSKIDAWAKQFSFEAIIPISAKHGTQMEALLRAMEVALPKGPQYFPRDLITDMPEKFIAAEMVREKVFRFTGQEIPYATAVTVESFAEDKKRSLVKIYASIHVERDSQKGIVIGKNGFKLKKIGEAARIEIERMMGCRVFLKLFVRVQKNWSKDTKTLRGLGY